MPEHPTLPVRVQSQLANAVNDTLFDAGYDPAEYEFLVLVDGFDTDGDPMRLAVADTGDTEEAAGITADLIRVFADSDLAVAR